MLSSIHPLGERGRNNRWGLTAGAFATSSILAGMGVGGALGYLGGVTIGSMDPSITLGATGALAVLAGILDLLDVPPPSPARQVNEHWIGYYRGWVYGAAFGSQLGLGFVTFIVTWSLYAALLVELLTASFTAGALVGGVFGLGRSLSVLATGWVDTPSRLSSFHSRMARLGPTVRRGTAAAGGLAGALTLTGVIL